MEEMLESSSIIIECATVEATSKVIADLANESESLTLAGGVLKALPAVVVLTELPELKF